MGKCRRCGRETSGAVSIFDDNGDLIQRFYFCSDCWKNGEPFEQEQCPFGDHKETCAYWRTYRCDLCKFEDNLLQNET